MTGNLLKCLEEKSMIEVTELEYTILDTFLNLKQLKDRYKPVRYIEKYNDQIFNPTYENLIKTNKKVFQFNNK